ncbi:hypothetical protein [Clostridium botulinum]|uniref:hypothetical protein n=1 Tax=Clostridium botulinum TaxID=1491 RepID=UPI0007732C5C|nr:hypothetical protein [Clostridium botulinum]AUM91525.1 hypothetical protein RSJ5_09650 [Clostridium botulinum]NFB12924.1 hypothetical protein [Clostridium botulinum]NFH57854.1 hypothetical protein [Clostridium botulinum]NFJ87273.1 hypothetical protein [Clostridium botulinum]NFV28506.1 hypothetical protein [Clostridium botulinum]
MCFNEFRDHINNNSEYDYYNCLYKKIKKDYKKKIKKNEINALSERVRLQSKIDNYNNGILNNVIALIIFSLSILFNGVISALGVAKVNVYIIMVVAMVFSGVILLGIIYIFSDKDSKELFLCRICLNVINDIIEDTNQGRIVRRKHINN